ncbi:sensor histidine kinase [Virgibacillus oceani]
MSSTLLYWVYIAIFGFIHLQALPFEMPILVTALLVALLVFLLYKRVILFISELGVLWNALLYGLQPLILIMYFVAAPSWLYLIPFILFIGVELIRQGLSEKMSILNMLVENNEAERERMNETFLAVRSERHDFLKHVSAIHFMLENDQYLEAKKYLDGLVEGYEETNLSIKGERGTVAAILHQMYKRAKASGIDIVYDIDIPLSTLPLSDKEMTALLDNLLSNSIEAAEEWQDNNQSQAMLSLEFNKRSGLYIIICRNKTIPVPNDILDNLFHSYGMTTKSDGHSGLGTKQIHDIVIGHHGFLDFVHKDEQFTVKIKIPAIH